MGIAIIFTFNNYYPFLFRCSLIVGNMPFPYEWHERNRSFLDEVLIKNEINLYFYLLNLTIFAQTQTENVFFL